MVGRLAWCALALGVVPYAGNAQPFIGQWCGPQAMITVELTSIGFNEHITCSATNLPVVFNDAGSWSSDIACESVHFVAIEEGGPEQRVAEPIEGLTRIALTAVADGTLMMTTDFHDQEIHFLPCD